MKKLLLCLGICVVTLGLAGCGQAPTLKDGKEVVAEIDGKKFTAEDLYEKLKSQGGATTLTSMIDEFILNKEIKTDEDAETYAESQLESYKAQYENYGTDFNEALTNAGYKDEDAFKDALIIEYKRKTATENFVKEQITDTEIEKYYEDSIYGDIEGAHILIAPDVDDNATDEEKEKAEKAAKEKAEKLIKELDKGADFAELAKKNSDDKGTASNGGKLTITYGDVVDEFWEGASKLKNKTYTKEPVKSEYGYHIIYRESQKDKPKLKAVRDKIIDDLVEQKMSEDTTLQAQAMVELRKKYDLKISDDSINKTYNENVKKSLAKENSSN